MAKQSPREIISVTHANSGRSKHGLDVIVVGAGVGGLYALYRLRKRGLRVQVLEQEEMRRGRRQ